MPGHVARNAWPQRPALPLAKFTKFAFGSGGGVVVGAAGIAAGAPFAPADASALNAALWSRLSPPPPALVAEAEVEAEAEAVIFGAEDDEEEEEEEEEEDVVVDEDEDLAKAATMVPDAADPAPPAAVPLIVLASAALASAAATAFSARAFSTNLRPPIVSAQSLVAI